MREGGIFLLLFMAACRQEDPPMELNVQGHRGCRGLLPENTISGFKRAVDLGVTTLELDVVQASDGRLVVTHEPWMSNRICLDSQGNQISEADQTEHNIYRMDPELISLYDCGSQGHPDFPSQMSMAAHKPFLSEAVNAVKAFCVQKNVTCPHFNIEIKSRPEWVGIFQPSIQEYVANICLELNRTGLRDGLTIQSFDTAILSELHSASPLLRLILLNERPTVSLDILLKQIGFRPHGYSVHFEMATEELIQQCETKEIELSVWTVNNVLDMHRVLDLGIGNVITDYPDRLLEVSRIRGVRVLD